MRLEHFHYIVEIARCKSMSKASKKLYITQPSLSTAIQNLEEELGFQIFKRSAAGVALTDKGEAMLDIAERVVEQMERVKELSKPENETIITLNLAAVPVFCNALMIQLIQALKKEHPNIHINILELRQCKILSTLISGAADLAIGTYSASNKEQVFQEAARNNLNVEPLFKDKMYCFLHRNHPLASKKVVYMEELENDTPALFNDFALMESYECLQPDSNEAAKNYYSFTDRASIKKAVSKGLAYAILPRLMAYDDIYVTSGMIVPVPVGDADAMLTTYIAYSNRNMLPKSTMLTIELIRKLYAEISSKMAAEDLQLEREENSAHQHLFY